MASELFNRQDVGRGSGYKNQTFCSRDTYISGLLYRGNWQLSLGSSLIQDGIKPVSLLRSYPRHSLLTLFDNLTDSLTWKHAPGELTESAIIEQGPQDLSCFLINPCSHPLGQHVAEKVPPRTLVTCAGGTWWSSQLWCCEAHTCKKVNESTRNSKESSDFHSSLAGCFPLIYN